MVTYTLTTPLTLGQLGNITTVAALHITGLSITSTPDLAPIDTGEMRVLLTETKSGWQQTIVYQDASVLDFIHSAEVSGTIGDALYTAVFSKLAADGNLPAGTISTDAAAATTGAAQ